MKITSTVFVLLLIGVCVAGYFYYGHQIAGGSEEIGSAVPLLANAPDTIELRTPLRDFRVNQPIDWSVGPAPNGGLEYRWSGVLDLNPESPGVIVVSGSQELEMHASATSLHQSVSGYLLEVSSSSDPVVERIHITSEEPHSYSLRIPAATTFLRFNSKRTNTDDSPVRIDFALADSWSSSLHVNSGDWKSAVLGPIHVSPGTHDLVVQATGVHSVFRDAYIQSLTLIEPVSVTVVLPEGEAEPRLLHRPKQPVETYLAGKGDIPEFGSLQWWKAPWRDYDEDTRWVRPVEIQRIVRSCLFLPSPSGWRVKVQAEKGSRLRFYPAVLDPTRPGRTVSGHLRVYYDSQDDRRLLWESRLDAFPLEGPKTFGQYLQPWQAQKTRAELNQPYWKAGVEVPLPESTDDSYIVFESAPGKTDEFPAPVFVGEPSLLPPKRVEDRGPLLTEGEILDWESLLRRLIDSSKTTGGKTERRIWQSMDWRDRVELAEMEPAQEISDATRALLVGSLNRVLSNSEFFSREYFKNLDIPEAARAIADSTAEEISPDGVRGLNRAIFESAFQNEILPRYRTLGPSKNRPNIVVISLDTLRGDSLSCLGYSRGTTPWMRTFFEGEGVRFSNAEAPSTWTLPSHASLFLSQYPSRHGVTRDIHSVPRHVQTLAEFLSLHGYETAAFVDRGFLHHHYGLNQGFQTYQQKGGGFREIVPSCLDFLGERDRTPPLFLFLHTFDIHDPYAPPHPFRDRFLLETMRPTSEDFWVPGYDVMRAANKGHRDLTREDRDYARALYDAQILYVDSELKRLFDAIEEKGILENTLVILLSDHGEGFGEHGFWAHGWTLYEEMTHIPLLMRFPETEHRGTLVEERVSLVDIPPTIADYLGLDAPENWQGVSLIPCIEDPDLELDRRTYSQLYQNEAMYQGYLKLIQQSKPVASLRNQESMPSRAVFDLKDDPYEGKNLVEDPPVDVDQEFERLAEALRIMAVQRDAEGGVTEVELDSEQVQELQALGYLK